ncbi:MAG: hypothetical protein U5K71_07830 [Gracilimonas sp.]|nr:hypothetical protein [Gracilimonas sp.]
MINTFKVLVFLAAISIGMIGCSATQKTTTSPETKSPAPAYPSWYQETAFQADSLSFIGLGEAVASDSMTAIKNAELQARVNLETGVSELVEETRKTLSENGNKTVDTPIFLIMLRNASQAIQDEGTVNNKAAVNKEGFFRGYVTVQISRSDAKATLRNGFDANQRFWQILDNSTLFD